MNMFITRRPVKRQGAQIWASRGNFLNNETESGNSVDILKTECKKDNVRNVSPTDETVAVNNNDDSEKSRQSDIKNIATSKRLSDSVLKPSLLATLSPTKIHLCADEISDELLDIVGGGLNKAPSKDSGLDQSPDNVTFDYSLSSNCEQLSHDIALDESGFAADTSQGEIPFQEKSDSSYQPSSSSRMSPETEFNDESMTECREEKTFENGEIMNPRSPFSLNFEGRGNFPLVQMVCRELLETERSYVNDLKEVIEGYIYHMRKNYEKEDMDVFDFFGNLEEIYEFNKEILNQIEQCEVNANEIDPIKLANVFCEQTAGFNRHYTQYCTEYPEAASALSYLMQDPNVANYFLERQAAIGHALSLESYLLKPVQRILKYNLLLKDILKRYCGDEEGQQIINTALIAMSDVAEYINEMKRLHENARHVEEILNNIIDMDLPVDRNTCGKFVLENTFKVQGVRGDRTIILFEKMLIFAKKQEDRQLQFKDHLMCGNMMLLESIDKEPLGFQLIRYDNQKETYTIVAKTLDIKKEWTQALKRLIIENFKNKSIPQSARQAILGEEQIKSKYSSMSLDTLDKEGTLRKQIPKGCKSPNIRDSVNMSSGLKRESNEKDSSKEAKRHLRPKNFLNENKNRSNVTSPTGTSTAEKEKKEKFRLIRRHKHKPSLDSNLNIETNAEEDNNNEFSPSDNLPKSRSLESLNVIKLQDDIEYKEESNDLPGSPEIHDTSHSSVRHRSKSTTNGPPSCHHKKGVGGTLDGNKGRSSSDTSKPNRYYSDSYSPSPDLSVDTEGILEESGADPSNDDNLSKQRKASEDSNPHSPIKSVVNRVSKALQNSFNINAQPSTNNSINTNAPMFFSPGQNSSPFKRDSKKTSNEDVDAQSSVECTKTDASVLSETDSRKNDTGANPLNSESECDNLTTTTDTLHPPKVDKGELSESEDSAWSTNVDALFYEVNADIDSIAGSIASDTAKSNESGSDVNTPTDSSTSIGIDVAEKRNDVDQISDERSEAILPIEDSDQVKQVADRIKEYKRLVDSEKRRHSWTQREPNIHEMIESLDSIQTVDSALSPTYSSLRRRFRPSKDYGSGRDVRSSLEICNELPRPHSPSRIRSLDSYVIDTSFVELDAKSGELLSQGQTSANLESSFQSSETSNDNRTSPTSKRESSSSSYEYVEAPVRSPDLISTADLLSSLSPQPLEGHILAKRNSLENVFYTEAGDEVSKSVKSSSLPLPTRKKNKKEINERKLSDTTNSCDNISNKNEPSIDMSAYSDLLKDGESVAKRTEVYFRALKNFEQHKRKPVFQKPKTPSFTTCDFSPLISRENLSNTYKTDELSSMPSADVSHSHLKSDDDKLKELSAKVSQNLTKCLEESIKQQTNVCRHVSSEKLPSDDDLKGISEECRHETVYDSIETTPSKTDFGCSNELQVSNDENNNESNLQTSCETSTNERTSNLEKGSDVNNNETNKVFHIGTDKKKVFRIGKEANNNEKKFFRIEKQKIKPYQFNNIEKRQPNENIEKVKLCRISGDDKTLRCRLDIVEKTKVSRQDEKMSCHESKPEGDKIRIFQQDSNGQIELNCEEKKLPNRSPSPRGNETSSICIEEHCEQLSNRRTQSVSVLPLPGSQLSRPPSRFTTETYINLDKRSLKKSNSTPPESCNVIKNPPNEKENTGSTTKDNQIKITSKIDKTIIHKKAPDIYTCTLPITKRVTRSCSMPSVNGILSHDGGREKSRTKREQIKQLKSNLDSCTVEESPRGRSKTTKNCSDETPTYQRSTSLPRRRANFLVIPNEDVEETKKSEKYVLRSPSIRNIQQNHVNNRIKDYFINLQKSSEISRSRPNLLLVDNNSGSGSDSEGSCEEGENNAENNVQICRGTVRSMIKKYGQVNFVFD